MRVYRLSLILCISWFIFLCLLHYLSARPLWLDEAFVLGNMQNLGFREMLSRPLGNGQAFPRFYLIAVKLFSGNFTCHVLFLRFLPLAAMLSAFFVWGRVYRYRFGDKWVFLLGLYAWASSYYFSYYAAELKQYSMDVLVVGIFVWFILHQGRIEDKQPGKIFIACAIFLPFIILLSYAGVFIFWVAAYNFLMISRKNKTVFPLFLVYTFNCLFAAVLMYRFDIIYAFKQQGLFIYWKDYFLCRDSFYCFFKSFGEGVERLGTWWFTANPILKKIANLFIPFFICPLFGLGIASLRKNRSKIDDMESVGLLMFAQLFILGILKIYPFTGERITLFLAPFVIFTVIKGIDYFKKPNFVNLALRSIFFAFFLMCGLDSLLRYLKLYR